MCSDLQKLANFVEPAQNSLEEISTRNADALNQFSDFIPDSYSVS
jgi:hypothetical protein